MIRRYQTLFLGVLFLGACTSTRVLPDYDAAELSWVKIAGDTFLMGDSFEGTNDDALPVHEVKVESFWLSRYETSFEQYDAYARARGLPRPMPDDGNRGRRAVSDISWEEAADFCDAFDARLPSEEEWEYAAADGSAKQLYAGTSDSLALDLFGSYRENSDGVSFAVGSKQPNGFGLFDMSGNVGEWVGEYYQKYPEADADPIIADTTVFDLRIIRGGSVWAAEYIARTYWRTGTLKTVRTPSAGFRCARD